MGRAASINISLALVWLIAVCSPPGSALSDQQRLPTREQVIAWLKPDANGKSRGLEIRDQVDPAADFGQVQGVLFAFGSADLQTGAKALLGVVASGLLSDQLAPFRYRITGYTDAVGSETTNFELSRMRALAVRDYLVSLGVPVARLEILGVGESDLADPAHPRSAVNRRAAINLAN
jgi:outer membrane protein OmpA-like peptidoglycan-associated protein